MAPGGLLEPWPGISVTGDWRGGCGPEPRLRSWRQDPVPRCSPATVGRSLHQPRRGCSGRAPRPPSAVPWATLKCSCLRACGRQFSISSREVCTLDAGHHAESAFRITAPGGRQLVLAPGTLYGVARAYSMAFSQCSSRIRQPGKWIYLLQGGGIPARVDAQRRTGRVGSRIRHVARLGRSIGQPIAQDGADATTTTSASSMPSERFGPVTLNLPDSKTAMPR